MGLAIQSVAAFLANPGATFAAAAAAPGDSLTIAAFNETSPAFLESVIRGGATAGGVRITSSRLHDAVRGITYYTDKAGTIFLLPRSVGQPLYPVDTFAVNLTGGTAETDLAVLTNYYADLPGVAARLVNFDDIASTIVNIKPVEVDVTASGTAGNWKDTALTTTESLLKAGKDYAVLGINTDTQLTAIGLLGPDTGNNRYALPGSDDTFSSTDGYQRLGDLSKLPHIPILNSENVNNTFVSVIDKAASTTAKVSIIMAELSQRVNV